MLLIFTYCAILCWHYLNNNHILLHRLTKMYKRKMKYVTYDMSKQYRTSRLQNQNAQVKATSYKGKMQRNNTNKQAEVNSEHETESSLYFLWCFCGQLYSCMQQQPASYRSSKNSSTSTGQQNSRVQTAMKRVHGKQRRL